MANNSFLSPNPSLLQPGFAGLLNNLDEARYIKENLERESTKATNLRRLWGFAGKRIPLTAIAARALPEDPKTAIKHIQSLQRSENRLKRSNVRLFKAGQK